MKGTPLTARDYRKLTSVKLTCNDCGTAHLNLRGGDEDLWKGIDKDCRLPAVHPAHCVSCCKELDHFVDWPSRKEPVK